MRYFENTHRLTFSCLDNEQQLCIIRAKQNNKAQVLESKGVDWFKATTDNLDFDAVYRVWDKPMTRKELHNNLQPFFTNIVVLDALLDDVFIRGLA